MKKLIALVSMAMLSVALHGQQSSAPFPSIGAANEPMDAARASASAPAPGISAELTKGIDTKRAKVGDEVEAKITDTVKFADGTEWPRGTKLVGKVTDVSAKSKDNKNAHLAFNLDHAVLKNGQSVPVRMALTSVTVPAQSVDMPMSGGGGAPGGGSSPGGANGGASSSTTPSAAPAMNQTMQQSMNQSATSSQGGVLTQGQDHVPVGNLPGVMLSASNNPSSAGSLDAKNQNIDLQSGTKLTLNLMAAQ
jgi:hypothetical protein